MARTTLTLEQRIEAAPPAVFHSFTNATALREWLCEAAMVVPRRGGRLHLWWTTGYHATGDFTRVVPDEQVRFTWRGHRDAAASRVQVTLRPDGDGTVVELVHRGKG
ncbi:MAG: SRPBCC domain-containing protein, partial [Actinobacteria bacterium]|nr:SRPBCC domain-containing protein [Actinomycetota bacterium]